MKTILLIEDDPDNLEMMIYVLKDAGYQVIAATDCTDLVQILQHQPDLILLDNRLPNISGTDICPQTF